MSETPRSSNPSEFLQPLIIEVEPLPEQSPEVSSEKPPLVLTLQSRVTSESRNKYRGLYQGKDILCTRYFQEDATISTLQQLAINVNQTKNTRLDHVLCPTDFVVSAYDSQEYFLITPWLEGYGSIPELLTNNSIDIYQHFEPIAEGISHALIELADHNLIHSDPHLGNFLFNPVTNDTILSDPESLCTRVTDIITHSNPYFPPEWFKENVHYGESSYVPVFGEILYRMFTGTERFIQDGSTKSVIDAKLTTNGLSENQINTLRQSLENTPFQDKSIQIIAILTTSLQLDRNDRFVSVRSMWEEMQKILITS